MSANIVKYRDEAFSVMHVEGLDLERTEDGELRIRDVQLAENAGLARPRDIRQLIKDNRESIEENGPVLMRGRRARIEKSGAIQGFEEREVEEYWLNEAQAYHVVALMRTAVAKKLLPRMARVFMLARRQAEQDARSAEPVLQRLIKALLLPKPDDWELMFQRTLVRELCRLDGHEWDGGTHPRYLRSTNRKIYDTVFSSPFGRVLKERNPLPRQGSAHFQHLTHEARDYFRTQLGVIEAFARTSASKQDFWDRLHREYGGGMLQLSMAGAE